MRYAAAICMIALVLSCSTSQGIGVTDAPHTIEDISRRYPASVDDVLGACLTAAEAVGANYFEPVVEIQNGSATMAAGTEKRVYGIILLADGDFTGAMLFVEDETSQEVLRKSVFDEFWSAVDQALLWLAVVNGSPELATAAVEGGANVHETNQHGQTPLMYASQNDYPRIVRLLIAAGSDLDQQTPEGASALFYAAMFGNP